MTNNANNKYANQIELPNAVSKGANSKKKKKRQYKQINCPQFERL